MRGYAPMPVTHHGQRGAVRVYETTRYELIAERGVERHLITYSARKTQRVMVQSIWDHRDALLSLFGLTADAENTIHGKGDRLIIGFPGGWAIRWSGRTEREAIQAGEYRSI